MVIGQGMAAEVRRVHERSLVSYYHKCLLEFGAPNHSWLGLGLGIRLGLGLAKP